MNPRPETTNPSSVPFGSAVSKEHPLSSASLLDPPSAFPGANEHRSRVSTRVAWGVLHLSLLGCAGTFLLQEIWSPALWASYTGLVLSLFAGLQLWTAYRRDAAVYSPLMRAGIRVRSVNQSRAAFAVYGSLVLLYAALTLWAYVLRTDAVVVSARDTTKIPVGEQWITSRHLADQYDDLEFGSDVPFLSPGEVLERSSLLNDSSRSQAFAPAEYEFASERSPRVEERGDRSQDNQRTDSGQG